MRLSPLERFVVFLLVSDEAQANLKVKPKFEFQSKTQTLSGGRRKRKFELEAVVVAERIAPRSASGCRLSRSQQDDKGASSARGDGGCRGGSGSRSVELRKQREGSVHQLLQATGRWRTLSMAGRARRQEPEEIYRSPRSGARVLPDIINNKPFDDARLSVGPCHGPGKLIKINVQVTLGLGCHCVCRSMSGPCGGPGSTRAIISKVGGT